MLNTFDSEGGIRDSKNISEWHEVTLPLYKFYSRKTNAQDYPGNAKTGNSNSTKSAELPGIMDLVIRLAYSLL
jgi:hypothetical protein